MSIEHGKWGPMGPGVYEQVTLEYGRGVSAINVEEKQAHEGVASISDKKVIIPDGMTANVEWQHKGRQYSIEVKDWRVKPNGRGGDAWVNFDDRDDLHFLNSGQEENLKYHGLNKASFRITTSPDQA